MSPELRVMAAPARAYRELQLAQGAGWREALARPAFVALLIGAAFSMASTERVTLGLVLSGTLCWSFVPAFQLLAAMTIISSAPDRRLRAADGVNLFFLGHAPWSLWLLGAGAWIAAVDASLSGVLLGGIVAAVWTAVIVFAFCTTVLGTTRRGAAFRTMAHQGMIWLGAALYIAYVSQLWPRLLARLEP